MLELGNLAEAPENQAVLRLARRCGSMFTTCWRSMAWSTMAETLAMNRCSGSPMRAKANEAESAVGSGSGEYIFMLLV